MSRLHNEIKCQKQGRGEGSVFSVSYKCFIISTILISSFDSDSIASNLRRYLWPGSTKDLLTFFFIQKKFNMKYQQSVLLYHKYLHYIRWSKCFRKILASFLDPDDTLKNSLWFDSYPKLRTKIVENQPIHRLSLNQEWN